MKVLFLDIDGVLNSYTSRVIADNIRRGDFGTHRAWNPECVDQLKRIIAETGCQIVISSDWRLGNNQVDLTNGFEAFQLPKWIGVTPQFGMNNAVNCNRGNEIDAWLFNWTVSHSLTGEAIESFAIVDDHNWMQPSQQKNFVQTSDETGLTESDASDIIRILNGNPKS